MSSNDPAGRGSGGKSLELMQQRLLSKPQASESASQNPPQQQQPQSQQPPQQQQQQQPQPQQPAASHPPAGGRGKDFAAMAASVGSASKARAASPTQLLQTQPGAVPVQQASQPGPPSAAPASSAVTAAAGRPKGKDFSAMANRMGAPPAPAPSPAPPGPTVAQGQTSASQPSINSSLPPPSFAPGTGIGPPMVDAQAVRAAALQATARAAAGLPPLEKPTATSVTREPPPVAAVRQKHFAQQTAAAVLAAQARDQQIAKMNSSTAASAKKTASTASLSRSSSIGSRRTSGNAKQGQLAPQLQQQPPSQLQQQHTAIASSTLPKISVSTTPIPSKPTPQPIASEGRLAQGVKGNLGGAAGSNSAPLGVSGPHMAPLIGQRIQDLVKSIDPNYIIDPDAEEQVLQLADDFLEKVTRQSIRLAQHRGSKILDVQDVQMVLSKQWGIVIPGLGPPSFKPTKSPGSSNSSNSKNGQPSGGSGGGGNLKRKSMDGNTPGESRNAKRANLGGLPPPPLTSVPASPAAGNSGRI